MFILVTKLHRERKGIKYIQCYIPVESREQEKGSTREGYSWWREQYYCPRAV